MIYKSFHFDKNMNNNLYIIKNDYVIVIKLREKKMEEKTKKTKIILKTQSYQDNNPNNVKLETVYFLMFPEARRGVKAIYRSSSYFGGGGQDYVKADIIRTKKRIPIENTDETAEVPVDVLDSIKSKSFKRYIRANERLVYRVLDNERTTLAKKVSSLTKYARRGL